MKHVGLVGVLAIAAVAGCRGGATGVSPYYTALPKDDESIVTKSSRRYFGQCPVHGVLTNAVRDRGGVERAVFVHNKKYHSDGRDTSWARTCSVPW